MDRANGTVELRDASQPCVVKAVAEQISHHPPVSAFYYKCDEKGIAACGLDHICARFTGTCKEAFRWQRAVALALQALQLLEWRPETGSRASG